MLVAAGIARDVDDGKARMKHALESGAGLAKLKEMIAAQGGDAGVCDDVTRLPQAKHLVPVPAPHDGYVADMDTTAIGYCAQDLGAGRKQKTDVCLLYTSCHPRRCEKADGGVLARPDDADSAQSGLHPQRGERGAG